MKTLRNIYLIMVMLTVISCDKLEEKPKLSLVVPSTIQDFQGILDNTTVLNSVYGVLPEISTNDFYLIQTRYDAISANEQKRAYTWEKNLFAGVSATTEWESPYQRIFYCNVVLDGLKELESSISTNTYNDIRGQALVHRASTFLSLVQEFAKPFNNATAGSDLGIPLRISSDLNIPSTRSTVAEGYKQIIGDLLLAKSLLPVTPVYKTRPSRPAAFGLLARVYLGKGDYTNAYLNADSCLQLYSKLIDYNSVSTTPTFPFAQLNDEIIFHVTFATSVLLYSRSVINQEVYNLYDNNDLRKSLFFFNNSDNTKSFRGQYTGSQLQFFGGIATDEMLLIRAECSARLGKKDEALSDLNTLLSRRYKTGTFVPLTANTADDALVKTIAERRKELLVRGLRWNDLRRLNSDPRFAVTLNRSLGTTVYTLSPNDSRYTFKIPDYIISLTGMQQNP